MAGSIVWLIDENPRQLKTYFNALKSVFPKSIVIKAMPPLQTKEEYHAILNNPGTACIIVDQKLKETGIATYTGIELAQYLRGINSKMPIFILTNFASEEDEFAGGEWSVDDIIPKDKLSDLSKSIAITEVARILRRIDVYEDILGQREQRFNKLLRKSLMGDFDDEERKELAELGAERAAPILADELRQLQKLEEIVTEHKKLTGPFLFFI